jgi:ketosteroid isomerase-like protein
MACVVAAAVNLAAAAMLSPREGALVPATAQNDPAASVSGAPAASPPVPIPAPAPPVPPANSPPEPTPRVPAPSRPTQLPPRDAVATVPRESLDLPPRQAPRASERAALRAALDEWIAATNARDLARQMTFYPPTVAVFYRERNVARSAVLAEKRRLFARAEVIDVQAGPPEIALDGADAATMRFRKTYDIRGPQASRRGEVVQELRWAKTPEGWKITSERDVQVIR